MSAREVILEVRVAGVWKQIGGVAEAEPPGSISSAEPAGRQVFVFGWLLGEGPGVWRSIAGADVETPAFREIASEGFERLANLDAGAYELELVTRRSGRMRARFRAA